MAPLVTRPLLEVEGVAAFYGEAQALFGVSFAVSAGEVVALLGRNGMGKTTTIRAICQLTRPSAGMVRFDGRALTRLSPHRAARLGIGLAPEGRRCFAPLTVWENLVAAARPPAAGGARRDDWGWDWARVTALFPRLAERRDQVAATLSGGEQQMLAIARALMTNPRLLILDEAAEGLAPVVRQEIWAALKQLKAGGQSILVVDKNLAELLPIADRCVVMERGAVAWSGRPNALTPELRDRHLGV